MAQNEWSTSVTTRIGRNIAAMRKRKGWSAEQLASATENAGFKIARQVIANIENGRRESIGIAELMIFADVLETSVVELIFPADSLMERFPSSPRGEGETFRARLSFTGQTMLKTELDPRAAGSEIFEHVLSIFDLEELAHRTLTLLVLAQAEDDEEEVAIRSTQLRARIAKGLQLLRMADIPEGSVPKHEARNLLHLALEHAPDLLEKYGFKDADGS